MHQNEHSAGPARDPAGDPDGHPVFESTELEAEFREGRAESPSGRRLRYRRGEWKRRWQLRLPTKWEPLWPLGVAGSAAGRIGRHWSAERRTITIGLIAFSFAAMAGLVGGIVLASIDDLLEEFPGFLLLVPAAIGIRGNIFGSMASRLGTSLRLGTFELRFSRGGVLEQNLLAVTALTLAISTFMGVAAWAIMLVLGRPSMTIWDFMTISIIGGTMASVVVYGASLGVIWLAVRFDWDLDSVAIPIITVIGDITGIPLLAVTAALLAGHGTATQAIAIVCLVIVAAILIVGWRYAGSFAKRIFAESLPLLGVVALIDLFAGAVIESQIDTLLGFSVFLIVLPAFLSASGGLGSTFVSRLGSKMHLGTISPRIIPDPLTLLDSTLVYLWGFFVFPVMALLAGGIATVTGATSPGVVEVVEVTLLAGALATTLALFVGYYTALITARFGLDPDNHGIPVVTSSMDFFGVIALAIALAVVT